MYEGSCITSGQYKNIYFIDRCLFEEISEEDQKELIEVDEKNYCEANGLKCILFYTSQEVIKFKEKLKYAAYSN